MAAVDYFLKIDGIAGESTNLKYKEYIVLDSFSWGETNTGHATTGAGAGAGASGGHVSFQDFHFTSKISKATPPLMLACASGKHLANAILIGLRTGQTETNAGQFQFLKYTLTDVLVSSVLEGGSGGSELPVDQISLNFVKIEVEYKEQRADGSLGATTNFAWNLRANAKI
jgi:type VI secretion system secreted protein Hcp